MDIIRKELEENFPYKVVKLDGVEVKDPSFGMDATWILPSQQNEAEEKGYVVVAPESVLATCVKVFANWVSTGSDFA